MVAFLDTEFLTSQIKGGPPAKLVSVGFVVCGKNFEEVTRFHSYIYAEDKLHDRFQEMTGIERKDLLSAPDYELVMEEVAEQLEAWEVSRIYVWGPDKYVIQRDLLEYRKDISKRTRKIVNRILRMIKDIEGTYSAKLDLQSAGIGSLKIICGLGTEVSHNALDDALYTTKICRRLPLAQGIAEYPDPAAQLTAALLNNTDTETYDIQTYFDRLDHDAYKNDPALYQVGCPFCGKPLVLNDIWLKRGNTGYYTEATCPDHGPWFLRFKLNRRDGLHWNFARCIETVRPESYARYKKLEKSQRERIRMKAERAGKKPQE